MEELLRCPFCGGRAEILADNNDYEDAYVVECCVCKACIGAQVQGCNEDRPCYLIESSAIAAWNRRVEG